ncbi:MAG: serine acetyltransferase [Tepidisphaeraceae bacterium]|jgi:serine O-acetyltransferase
MPGLFSTIRSDLRRKALWCYESDSTKTILKVLMTDGTAAMIVYRLMQWSGKLHLSPLEMFFNKFNALFSNCIIGRGADFGPGFVLIHATGVVINGRVKAGSNVSIEHQVTIGAEERKSPVIGNDVFIGAGAKIVGNITIGDGARIGVNAGVMYDVPPFATAAGNPARIVSLRHPTASAVDVGQRN